MARSHFGARFSFLAGETASPACINDFGFLAVQICQHIGFTANGFVVFPDGEMTVAQRRLAGFERAAFGFPFGNTAVEHRDVMRAEQG